MSAKVKKAKAKPATKAKGGDDAEVLTDYEFRNMNNAYPWDSWSDGKTRRITKGKHFDVGVKSMVGAIYAYARRNAKKAKVNTDGESIVFAIIAA